MHSEQLSSLALVFSTISSATRMAGVCLALPLKPHSEMQSSGDELQPDKTHQTDGSNAESKHLILENTSHGLRTFDPVNRVLSSWQAGKITGLIRSAQRNCCDRMATLPVAFCNSTHAQWRQVLNLMHHTVHATCRHGLFRSAATHDLLHLARIRSDHRLLQPGSHGIAL